MTYLENFGLICLGLLSFNLARKISVALYRYVFGPMAKNIKLNEFGQWAVITGASDGLGKAYARAIAHSGVSVILIARNKDKLTTVADEIERDYNVRTRIIVHDFTDAGTTAYHDVEKVLWTHEIGILINNVGMSNPHPEYFLEVPEKERFYTDMVLCNIMSVTNMTQIVLPKMIERKKGLVVNISSIAATIPSPLLSVYAGTKAYIEKLSDDLNTEYGGQGVFIQCLTPGLVATKMSKIRRASWMAPTPEEYVKSAIRSIGVMPHTTGYFPHSMMRGVINFFDGFIPPLMRHVIMRSMLNIRRRAVERGTS